MNQGRSGQEQNNHPAEADQTVVRSFEING